MKGFGILVLATLAVVGLSLLLLGVQTFFSKRRKFPEMHVGGNKALAKKGIYCVQTQDALARRDAASTMTTKPEEVEDAADENER